MRPYNAAPDALLLNFQSVVMGFVPDPGAGVAHIQYDPPMAGVQRPDSVALAASGTGCGDWRGALRAELSDPPAPLSRDPRGQLWRTQLGRRLC